MAKSERGATVRLRAPDHTVDLGRPSCRADTSPVQSGEHAATNRPLTIIDTLVKTPAYTAQTQCWNKWGGLNVARYFPVAVFHTHPNVAGDSLFGCPFYGSQQTPNGPGKVQTAGDEAKNGGGSDADWDSTNGPNWQVPTYIMAKSGIISRLNQKTAKNKRKRNQDMWQWRNSACHDWGNQIK